MSELLLLSNSTAPGGKFLEHAAEPIKDLLGERSSILFVPFAGLDLDYYANMVRDAMKRIGVRSVSLHEAADPVQAIRSAQAVFTGGGNSFRLLRTMTVQGYLAPLRAAVLGGTPYMGVSAGSNLAGPSIRTTNDMPIVEAPSLTALGVIPFQLNPHYIDADPDSLHQGETRQQRLLEFLDENDVPVLGLREGSWLRVSGRRATLAGTASGRLFRRGSSPSDVGPGTDLSSLLETVPRFDTRAGR